MLYVNPLELSRGARADRMLEGPAREKTAVQEFERYFLYTLLHEMRETVPRNDLFGDSQSRRVYEDMLDDHMAGQMARSGQFGIGKQIEAQLRQSETRVRVESQPANGKGLSLEPEQSGISAGSLFGSREAQFLPIKRADTSARGTE